jgi:uridylate kinase
MEENKHIIISLGGSLIYPDEIDTDFVSQFVTLIKEYVAKDFKFVIITGGGKVCRRYQDSLKKIAYSSARDIDWLGIYVTQLNAQFIRLAFGDLAYNGIATNIKDLPSTDKPIIVGAGHEPGASTDLNAIFSAEKVGAKKVINLSNIDYAYDKDPNIFPDAVKIEQSTWSEFRKILPLEWTPGLNAPFDPIAAEKAENSGIEVAIMNGKNLENLKNYLDGQVFIGTVIH